MGYNANFLNAVFKAKGEAIAIADQDDIWLPAKLEKQVALLEQGYNFVFHKRPAVPCVCKAQGKAAANGFQTAFETFYSWA